MRKLLLVASVTAVATSAIGVLPAAIARDAPAPSFTKRALHPGALLTAPARYRGRRVRRYRWDRCNQAGRACRRIRGATHRSYRVRKTDVGHTFRVKLTVITPNGSVTVTTVQTPVIAPPGPVNLTPPTISGTAQQGQTLTSDPGTWQNAVTFTYQWEDCDTAGANCAAISGATSTTYVLQATDVGHTIRLAVTAHNGTGSSSPAISRAAE